MKLSLAATPVATIIILIVAVAGAIVTISHPGSLTFADYVKYTMIGAGLLGIGRGLDATHKP